MMTKNLTIEFPIAIQLPDEITTNQELLRYAIAGSLYTQGILSAFEAQQLTGEKNRREFENKFNQYGFVFMPDSEEDIQIELNA